MKSALTKRVLDMLTKLAADEPEKYQGFWKEFGSVLKKDCRGLCQPRENWQTAAFLLNT